MKEELLELLYNYLVNGIIADKTYIEKFNWYDSSLTESIKKLKDIIV